MSERAKNYCHARTRLAGVSLGKEREQGVGKLGWHGNFDTGFERNNSKVFNLELKIFCKLKF